MFKRIHIYDVDGVLVDSNARYPSRFRHTPSELEYWNNPEALASAHQDKLLPMAEFYKRDLLDPAVYVVIATARVWTYHSRIFFERNLGMPDKIICRTNFKRIPDAEIKVRGLKQLFALKQFAGLKKRFWDDSAKNVYAVSELGVECFLVQ